MHGDNTHVLTIKQEQIAELSAANALCVKKDGAKDRFQRPRRARYYAQHIGRRRPLRPSFVSLPGKPSNLFFLVSGWSVGAVLDAPLSLA